MLNGFATYSCVKCSNLLLFHDYLSLRNTANIFSYYYANNTYFVNSPFSKILSRSSLSSDLNFLCSSIAAFDSLMLNDQTFPS